MDDPPHVGQFELTGNELVVGPNILEGIFGHESLQVSILLNDVGGIEVVDVGALHAQCHEDLTAHEESAPALDAERNALVLGPELIAELMEANLLDDLEAVHRPAPLAVHLELLGDEVTHHRLQSHRLPGKGEPHASEPLDVLLREALRDLPLRCRYVRDRVIRHHNLGSLSISTSPLCLRSGVVGHQGQVFGDLGLLLPQLVIDGLRVDGPLVDGL